MKALLTAGADVNAEDDSGTLLTAAIENGHHECVEFLNKSGACVNQQDLFRETPIFYAAYRNGTTSKSAAAKGNEQKVKKLLTTGADVNAEDDSGTPLTAAVENEHHKLVEFLLNEGADVYQPDFLDETPIFYVANFR